MPTRDSQAGSVHDARVFRASPIGKALTGEDDDMPPSSICPNDAYIIVDAAYPLLPNVITPFKNVGPNEHSKERFNFIHPSNRMVVARTNALLKGRNRRLMYYLDVVGEEDIAHVIMTACVIHQLAFRCDGEKDLQELMDDVATMQPDDCHVPNAQVQPLRECVNPLI
jgi:hypothetical protein